MSFNWSTFHPGEIVINVFALSSPLPVCTIILSMHADPVHSVSTESKDGVPVFLRVGDGKSSAHLTASGLSSAPVFLSSAEDLVPVAGALVAGILNVVGEIFVIILEFVQFVLDGWWCPAFHLSHGHLAGSQSGLNTVVIFSIRFAVKALHFVVDESLGSHVAQSHGNFNRGGIDQELSFPCDHGGGSIDDFLLSDDIFHELLAHDGLDHSAVVAHCLLNLSCDGHGHF